MAKGLLILLWVFLIARLFQKTLIEAEASPIEKNYSINRATKGYAILLFSLPLAFATFRTEFVDTAAYFWGFEKIKTELPLSDYLTLRGKDELFYALEYSFKKYVSSDAQVFFGTLALIESILLMHTLRRYSENLGISIYIFVASALYFNWMCNGVRQFLTVTILFALTDCIIKKKWYIFFPVVLLLGGVKPFFSMLGWGTPFWLFCGIHQSSLIVIPIYFIVRGRALTKKVWVLLVALLLIAAFGLLDSVLETSTENTLYAKDLTIINEDSGANPIRFLVSFVPVVLVIINQKKIVSSETPALIHLSINMSFVASVLYLTSVFTSGIYIGRLPIYCELYNLILIPWLINHTYEKDKRTISIFLYVLYLIYFIYQLFFAWKNILYTVSIFGLEF